MKASFIDKFILMAIKAPFAFSWRIKSYLLVSVLSIVFYHFFIFPTALKVATAFNEGKEVLEKVSFVSKFFEGGD